MIYKLCEGDITRKKFIEDNLDIIDFIEWSGFQKYENYIEREAVKRFQNANK